MELRGLMEAPRPEPPHGKYYIGAGAAYFNNWTSSNRWGHGSAWVTVVIEPDEETGEFGMDLDCDGPHPDHWLGYLLSMDTLNGVLGFIGGVDEQLKQMMEWGVAPGQRFIIELVFSAGRDYWGEYDESLNWRVMDVEPWVPNRLEWAIRQAVAFAHEGVLRW